MLSESGDDESGSESKYNCSTSNKSPDSRGEPGPTCQNRNQYPLLCQMMERSGVSNRDACNIINAYLQDMQLNKPENLIEPTKLRRQRLAWRKEAVSLHAEVENLDPASKARFRTVHYNF